MFGHLRYACPCCPSDGVDVGGGDRCPQERVHGVGHLASRARLLKARLGCAMTAPSLRGGGLTIQRLVQVEARVKAGIAAAGHYRRPLLTPQSWPAGWSCSSSSPGHVTEQIRVLGSARSRPTLDLEAITELLLPAGDCRCCKGHLGVTTRAEPQLPRWIRAESWRVPAPSLSSCTRGVLARRSPPC